MENTITYKLFKDIDIERFEKEYKDVLRRVAKGDAGIAQKQYMGLMAACDKLYETDNRERWKADYMYLGIMQPVLEKVVSETPLEKEVCSFLNNISVWEVKRLFELLEQDLDRPEDSAEESEFERYCMEIDALPIVDFAFAYEDTRFFLHKDVESKSNGYLGTIVQAIHVLSYVAFNHKEGKPSSVIVQDACMYASFFEQAKEERMRERNEGAAGYGTDSQGPVDSVLERKIDDATLRIIEQAQREQQNRANYADASFSGKVKSFCKNWNAIITKFFGKKVIPLFWLSLIILYIGNLFAGIIITLALYFVGKHIK